MQLASDSTRTFVIGESVITPRIYREKGTDNWWTKDELQRLGEPENPATSIRLNGKARCAEDARKSAQMGSGHPTLPDTSSELARRECAECRTVFEATREWKRFCSTSCRRAWWKQARKRTEVNVLTSGNAVA